MYTYYLLALDCVGISIAVQQFNFSSFRHTGTTALLIAANRQECGTGAPASVEAYCRLLPSLGLKLSGFCVEHLSLFFVILPKLISSISS